MISREHLLRVLSAHVELGEREPRNTAGRHWNRKEVDRREHRTQIGACAFSFSVPVTKRASLTTDHPPERRETWGGRIVRLVLAGGIAGVIVVVFSPFLSPLLWAGILCYALYPLYCRLVSAPGGPRELSALVMCLLLTIGVIAPLVYLSLLIAEDLTEAYVGRTSVFWIDRDRGGAAGRDHGDHVG